MLTKDAIKKALIEWNRAWDNHDLEGVMALFHDLVVFENWTGGRVEGKESLRKAWAPWFKNHGGFRFTDEDLFIDEGDQKALYRWQLDWPCSEKQFEGRLERRRGVDVIHFRDGKIISKLTYSKTVVEIDGKRVPLSPARSE